MRIRSLAVAAAVAMSMIGTMPAAAQPRHDREVVRTKVVQVHRTVNDNGRHRGWHKKVKVCRNVWRNHHSKRVCTWRYR
jgi:hypothetical protein